MKGKTKTPLKNIAASKSSPNPEAVEPSLKKALPRARRVTFSVRADVGSAVFLAGSFNNWEPLAQAMADKKGEGVYTATLSLPAGDHQYKFVIDGVWCTDPGCADSVQNGYGTNNSVRRVI